MLKLRVQTQQARKLEGRMIEVQTFEVRTSEVRTSEVWILRVQKLVPMA